MKKILLITLLFVFQIQAQDVNTLLKEADSISQTDPSATAIRYKLTKALKIEPRNEAALFKICEYYLNINGANHYAYDYINTLIEVNPNKAQYYWMRVQIFLSDRAPLVILQQSLSDLDKVVELSGHRTNRILRAQLITHSFLGKEYYKEAGQEPESIEDLTSFEDGKANPKKAEYYKLALKHCQQSIELAESLKNSDTELYEKSTRFIDKSEYFLKLSEEKLNQLKS